MGLFPKKTEPKVVTKKRKLTRESAPRSARALIFAVTAFLLGGLLWAANTEVKELAKADGEIIPSGRLRKVEHFDGGLIVEIRISEGQHVERNQVLAVLTSPGLLRERSELLQRLDAIGRHEFLVRALLENPEVYDELPELGQLTDSEGLYGVAQRKLFLARQKMLRERVEQRVHSIEIARAARNLIKERVALSQANFDRVKALHDKGYATVAQLNAQEDDLEQLRSEMLDREIELARASNEHQDARAAKNEALLSFREEQLEQMFTLAQDRQQVAGKLSDLEARFKRLEVRAPQAGVVQTVKASSVGEVIEPGGTVVELLPTGQQLVAEIRLNPDDIGHVEIGDSVTLKPTSYDTRRYGRLTGRVASISPTSIVPDREEPYFKTIVTLDQLGMGVGGNEVEIKSGMIVTAEIMTNERTVLNYLLKPINRSLESSMSER